MTRTILRVALLLLVAATACDENDPPTGPILPVGDQWRLIHYGAVASDIVLVPDSAEYFIRLEPDQTITGANACNACGGTFEIGPGAGLTIAPSCEEAACGNGRWLGYADALARVTSFALKDEGFVLYYANAQGELWKLVHVKEVDGD